MRCGFTVLICERQDEPIMSIIWNKRHWTKIREIRQTKLCGSRRMDCTCCYNATALSHLCHAEFSVVVV